MVLSLTHTGYSTWNGENRKKITHILTSDVVLYKSRHILVYLHLYVYTVGWSKLKIAIYQMWQIMIYCVQIPWRETTGPTFDLEFASAFFCFLIYFLYNDFGFMVITSAVPVQKAFRWSDLLEYLCLCHWLIQRLGWLKQPRIVQKDLNIYAGGSKMEESTDSGIYSRLNETEILY